jgi:hypothetical protein
MRSCEFYQFIFSSVPFLRIKDWVMRHHFDRCPRCRQELADLEEIRPLYSLLQPEKISPDLLWFKIKLRLEADRKEKREFISTKPFRPLRLALVSGLSIFLIIISLFIISGLHKKKSRLEAASSPETLRIIRFEVKEKPAAPVIYKPFGSNLIFIWAESPETKITL